LSGILLCCLAITSCGQSKPVTASSGFKKTKITGDFLSEGVAVADLNKDGRPDIVAGYYWFEAPAWKRHQMAPSRTFDPRKEYSNSFLNLGLDVNLDGWDDVVVIDYPGFPGFWFENPKNRPGDWKKHIIAGSMGIANESPAFVDVDDDGRLDILCGDKEKKQIVWLKPPGKPGETEWKRYALSHENVPGTEQYSHSIGYGDVNKDGIKDVVIREGWFQGTSDNKAGNWVFHPARLGEPCSHMQVLDVNGDGKNDVVSASAHELGVCWYTCQKLSPGSHIPEGHCPGADRDQSGRCPCGRHQGVSGSDLPGQPGGHGGKHCNRAWQHCPGKATAFKGRECARGSQI
jgi:hypothetical protein